MKKIIILGLMIVMQSVVVPAQKNIDFAEKAIKESTLQEFIQEYKAAIGSEHCSADTMRGFELFCNYCRGLNDQALTAYKDDLRSLSPHGTTLFTLAQRIRQFEENNLVPSRLDFTNIPNIEWFLEELLLKLQQLTTKEITWLDLSDNKLNQIPSTIFELENLENLNLANNNLEHFPDYSYKFLTKLKYLNVACNTRTRTLERDLREKYLNKLNFTQCMRLTYIINTSYRYPLPEKGYIPFKIKKTD